ncbi:MAG: mechanosensitive ion channel family protein [Patescibacteria group bacterium]
MDAISKAFNSEGFISALTISLPKLLSAFFILLVFWVIYHFTKRPLMRLLAWRGVQQVNAELLVNTVYRVLLFLIAVVIAAGQIGINLAATVAGLGIAGIALGFAAQDTLANIISGVLIYVDKPFKIGQWITVGDMYGRVQKITMRTTRIRTLDNTFVVIPNQKIANEVLINHSSHGELRIAVPFGIAYQESVPRVREVLVKTLSEIKGVRKEPAPSVVAEGFGDSAIKMLARVWVDNADKERATLFMVVEKIKETLEAEKITIPVPQMSVQVTKER